jgi:hypothetical protein
MTAKSRSRYAFLVVALLLSGCAARQPGNPTITPADWTREELFLGLNKPDGSQVSNSEFEAFIIREVASRLCCFTVLNATGYYTSNPGKPPAQESTRVLVVMYGDSETEVAGKIAAIAQSYVRTFSQESVLRVAARVRAHFVK